MESPDIPEIPAPQPQDPPAPTTTPDQPPAQQSTLIGDDTPQALIAALTATLRPTSPLLAPGPVPDPAPLVDNSPDTSKIENLQTLTELEKRALRSRVVMDRRRARKIAADLALGLPAKQVLIRNGYSPATAHGAAAHALANPMIVEARQELRDAIKRKANDHVDRVAAVVVDGLGATKITHFAHDGVVKDQREDPDHQARSRYVDMWCRIFGVAKDEGVQGGGINIGQFFVLMQQAERDRGLGEVDG